MTNSADPDQLASSEPIWIYIVFKGRVYLGSAGQGLTSIVFDRFYSNFVCMYIWGFSGFGL